MSEKNKEVFRALQKAARIVLVIIIVYPVLISFLPFNSADGQEFNAVMKQIPSFCIHNGFGDVRAIFRMDFFEAVRQYGFEAVMGVMLLKRYVIAFFGFSFVLWTAGMCSESKIPTHIGVTLMAAGVLSAHIGKYIFARLHLEIIIPALIILCFIICFEPVIKPKAVKKVQRRNYGGNYGTPYKYGGGNYSPRSSGENPAAEEYRRFMQEEEDRWNDDDYFRRREEEEYERSRAWEESERLRHEEDDRYYEELRQQQDNNYYYDNDNNY